ncbi:MAG: hypothetical protein O7G88_23090 [bacterium]|nr:hypothetical protein [bacterium]
MFQAKQPLNALGIGIGLLLLGLSMQRPSTLWAQAPTPKRQPKASTQLQPRRVPASPTNRVLVKEAAESDVGVTLQDNLLSLDVRDQPLRSIIERIAAQGDMEVRHLQEMPDTRISIRFTALPVVDGLKRLFRVAELPGYMLITEGRSRRTRVQRILFLPVEASKGSGRSRVASRPPRTRPTAPPRSTRAISQNRDERKTKGLEGEGGGSVFDVIKSNTTARRLLSQLVHPNEQVRERALERLIRLVGDDEKQAELLEFLEPLMDDLASEERTVREEARTEVRKLLRR